MNLLYAIILFHVNPLIQEMVGKVSEDSVLAHVQRLQGFVCREYWCDSCYAAADWLYNRFAGWGLDSVYRDTFTSDPVVPPNIVGIHRGALYPDSCYVIIIGHYDAINEETPETLAPGAEDNASGVAAVLEAARILKDYEFEENIRFVPVSAEEGMMLGSFYYAYRACQRGDDIRAVINVDMIGYTDVAPETLEVFSDTLSEFLADHFIACADTYTTILTRKREGSVSDEVPFGGYGYRGIGIIDDAHPDVNPYRHSPEDTIGAGFNDLQFCSQSIRAIIAALASRSRPLGIIEKGIAGPKLMRISVQPSLVNHFGQVSFSLTQTRAVRIKIYNIAGRLIRTILDQQKAEGNYLVRFDAHDFSQGTYILMMESGQEKTTAIFCVIR
jgi:hypothetical protein